MLPFSLTFLSLFIFLTTFGLVGALRGLKFHFTLPLCFMASGTTLIAFGLFHKLNLGLLALALLWVLALAFGIVELAKAEHKKAILARLFTPAFYFYFTSLIFFAFALWGQKAIGYDDFTNWVSTVKGMWQNGTFSTARGLHTTFSSYPEGMGVVQFAVQTLYHGFAPSAPFVEWLCYFAYHAYALALCLPFWAWVKNKWQGVFLACVSLFLPLVFTPHFYSSAYIDGFLSLVMASLMGVMLLEDEGKWQFAYLALATVTLIFTKDIGFYFALCFVVVYGVAHVGKTNALTHTTWLGGFALLAKVSWSLHLKVNAVAKAFGDYTQNVWHTNFPFLEFVSLKFLKFIIKEPVLWHLSFVLLFAFAFLALWFLLHKVLEKKVAKHVFLALLACVALYVGTLPLAYVSNFTHKEASELAEVKRYLNIPCAFLCFFNAMLWLKLKPKSLYVALATALVVALSLPHALPLATRQKVLESQEERKPYDAFAHFLATQTQGVGDVFVVRQENNPFPRHVLSMALMPQKVNEDFNLVPSTTQDLLDATQSYPYLALWGVNDDFRLVYATLFEDGIMQGLYQRTANGFRLIKSFKP